MSEVEAFQNPWEFDVLLTILHEEQPTSILEVGAMWGGTLWHWVKLADRVVVVDDAMRRADDWERWASVEDTDLVLLQGLSQDEELVAQARELGPYQFVFIDGDHSYDVVRADWEHFSPMVSAGGVVAFHDILARPGYGVSRVWAEVKEQTNPRVVEITHNVTLPGNEGPCGIGVVWV